MTCHKCSGTGQLVCTWCGGQGKKPDPARGIATCSSCGGTGRFKCGTCGGSGRL